MKNFLMPFLITASIANSHHAFSMEAPEVTKAFTVYTKIMKGSYVLPYDKQRILDEEILKICKTETKESAEKIIAELIFNMVNAYNTGSAYSYAKSKAGYESDNLTYARYLLAFSKKAKLNIKDMVNDEAYLKFYGTYANDTFGDSKYLQSVSLAISALAKNFSQTMQQKEQGIIGLGESGFLEMSQIGDLPDVSVNALPSLDKVLEDGIDGINKLGIFYGGLAAIKAIKILHQPDTPEKKDLIAAALAQNKRYATEIIQYNAIPTNDKLITKDATAMIIAKNNTISIVFGGMGVGEGGIVEGIKLAYQYNNPPLLFSGLGGAHEGFFKRLSVSWDEIYTFCQQYAGRIGQPLTSLNFEIIGHSMGGGVAPIAALRLSTLTFKDNPGDQIKVITFGAPRSLDATLAATYNAMLLNRTYMFVHEGDINVPDQPPYTIGYIHVGKRIKIPQPNVNADHATNIKVFHQYPGYKNVLDTCDSELKQKGEICARVEKEDSTTVYALQTAKNLLLSPIRVMIGTIFGKPNDLIENQYPQ